MDYDRKTQKLLAMAMIAGANAIENSHEVSDNFSYAGISILYREAAILLREKAGEIIYKPYLKEDKPMLVEEVRQYD